LGDEVALDLMDRLQIFRGDDVAVVRERYDERARDQAGAPSFERVIAEGWVRVCWGRVRATFGAQNALEREPVLRDVLGPALKDRHLHRYALPDEYVVLEPARSTVDVILNAPETLREVACARPALVAARLWETRSRRGSDPSSQLRDWLDRWALLGRPRVCPGSMWIGRDARDFRSAALSVLRSDPGLLGWENFRARLTSRLAHGSGRQEAEAAQVVGPIPATIFDREQWLDRQEFGRLRDDFETCGDLWSLVNLLVNDYEDRPQASDNVLGELFAIAIDRPELLSFLTMKAQREPLLLAEMLLEPRFAAVACSLIPRWTATGGAYDRELTEADDHAARQRAFADGAAILGTHLRKGEAQASEVAALLRWLHSQHGVSSGHTREAPRVDDALLAIAHAEVSSETKELQRRLVEALAETARREGLGAASFTAVLTIVARGELWNTSEPAPFVEGYVNALRRGDYALGRIRVSPDAACALVRMVEGGAAQKRREFYCPIDLKTFIAEHSETESNPYTVRGEAARAVRGHIRFLCRAVSGWKTEPPPELVSALVDAVRMGAQDRENRGRIDAFAASNEAGAFGTGQDRPLAGDVGAALSALDGDGRTRLLDAILESEEPLVLAQLLTVAPASTWKRIRERIAKLTPEDASELTGLDQVQARVGALIAADLPEIANAYLDRERHLETFGPVAEREVTRLRMELQIRFLRHDHEGISRAIAPPDLSPSDQRAATDLIDFFKALSELHKENGDLRRAESIMARLRSAHPYDSAYAMNLFALRTLLLMGRNAYSVLNEQDRRAARDLLEETDRDSRWQHGLGEVER
jgi:hypothetical protein